MDWENERYVRVYTRDTGDLLAVGWQGRALLWEMMRKADRAGVLRDAAEPVILAEMVRMPTDIVEPGIERLIKRGVVVVDGGHLVLPNFVAAQEAKSSDRQRKREERARKADRVAAREAGVDLVISPTLDVTIRDDLSRGVTGGHSASHDVTPSLAVPSLAVPSLAERERARGRAGSPSPGPNPGISHAAREPANMPAGPDGHPEPKTGHHGQDSASGGTSEPDPDPSPAMLLAETQIAPPGRRRLIALALLGEHNRQRNALDLPAYPVRDAPVNGPVDHAQLALASYTPAELANALAVAAAEIRGKRAAGKPDGGKFYGPGWWRSPRLADLVADDPARVEREESRGSRGPRTDDPRGEIRRIPTLPT